MQCFAHSLESERVTMTGSSEALPSAEKGTRELGPPSGPYRHTATNLDRNNGQFGSRESPTLHLLFLSPSCTPQAPSSGVTARHFPTRSSILCTASTAATALGIFPPHPCRFVFCPATRPRSRPPLILRELSPTASQRNQLPESSRAAADRNLIPGGPP